MSQIPAVRQGDLDLGQLRAFVAVAEHGSVTKASAQLHVAQPTLSRHVQRLERALQAPLFIRERNGVRLTAQGELMLTKARTVITLADDLTNTALFCKECMPPRSSSRRDQREG